jgi:hypothetical protein
MTASKTIIMNELTLSSALGDVDNDASLIAPSINAS